VLAPPAIEGKVDQRKGKKRLDRPSKATKAPDQGNLCDGQLREEDSPEAEENLGKGMESLPEWNEAAEEQVPEWHVPNCLELGLGAQVHIVRSDFKLHVRGNAWDHRSGLFSRQLPRSIDGFLFNDGVGGADGISHNCLSALC